MRKEGVREKRLDERDWPDNGGQREVTGCGGYRDTGERDNGNRDKRIQDHTALSQETQRIPTRLTSIPTSPSSTIHDIEFRIISTSTIIKEGVSTSCNHTWLITIDVARIPFLCQDDVNRPTENEE